MRRTLFSPAKLLKFSVLQLALLGVTTVATVAATQKPAHAFFEICNATSETVWTALGYYQNDQWWARGWWRLSPGECKLPIGESLRNRYYYVHAHTSSRSATWEDNYRFCTSSRAFNLQDSSNCSENSERFVQVDTRDYTGFTFNLCPPGGCPSGNEPDPVPSFDLDDFSAAASPGVLTYVRPRSRQD